MSGPVDLYQGQQAEMLAHFTDEYGAPYDPQDIRLKVRPPKGPDREYTGAAVLRVSLGTWHAFILADVAGAWRYRWTARGSVVGGGVFTVMADTLGD